MTAALRPATLEDVPGLLAVQRACYGDAYLESGELYARRLACSHQHSLVLHQGGQVCAYLAAYDSRQGCITPLHGEFQDTATADTLYLHDLAIRPDQAGQGWGQLLLHTSWRDAAARGLTRSALVAVQGSQAFWQRRGYETQPVEDAAQRQGLASYGPDAAYMARALGTP